MKKKILVIAAAIGCISILGYGSLAYYSAEDTAHNVITTNGVAIAIEEWQKTDKGLEPYPEDKPIAVMPTSKVSKIVTVRNNEAQSFIRAQLDVSVIDSANKEMNISSEEMKKIITLNMNTQDWTLKDGWWYYNSTVKTGEATKALMTGVEFDGPNMTNEYQNCTVEIDVDAQAVQTANNGTDPLKALGWPEQ